MCEGPCRYVGRGRTGRTSAGKQAGRNPGMQAGREVGGRSYGRGARGRGSESGCVCVCLSLSLTLSLLSIYICLYTHMCVVYIYIYTYIRFSFCIVFVMSLHPLRLSCPAEPAEDMQVLTAELVAEFDQGKACFRCSSLPSSYCQGSTIKVLSRLSCSHRPRQRCRNHEGPRNRPAPRFKRNDKAAAHISQSSSLPIGPIVLLRRNAESLVVKRYVIM